MKLTAVSNNQQRQKINNNSNNSKQNQLKNNKNVNFTGFADFPTLFWNVVDKFGRGGQFTVEDMCGTNIPRTYQGAMSGYKRTGKISWNYFKQEGIREFLTGPTMTAAPYGILAIATALVGKSANIHRKNISNLSYLLKENLGNENLDKEAFTDKFYKAVVKDMLEKTTEKEASKENIDSIVEEIKKYSQQSARAKTHPQKKRAKEILANLEATFEKIVKNSKDNYSNTNFHIAKYSTYGKQVESTKFENYIKYISAYAQDYAKANNKDGVINLADEAIKKFETLARGRRGFVIASMILLTGYLMSYIPKLYTWASGSQNPAGQAIYAEVEKKEGK